MNLPLTFAIDRPSSLSCLLFEWIGQVRLIKLNVKIGFYFWIVAIYFFKDSLGCFLVVFLIRFCFLFHLTINFDLFEITAFLALCGVHRRVFYWRKVNFVFFLSACGLFLIKGDAFFLTNFFVEFDHIGLGVFAV